MHSSLVLKAFFSIPKIPVRFNEIGAQMQIWDDFKQKKTLKTFLQKRILNFFPQIYVHNWKTITHKINFSLKKTEGGILA